MEFSVENFYPSSTCGIGLANGTDSSYNFMQTLLNQNLIEEPVFGLNLESD